MTDVMQSKNCLKITNPVLNFPTWTELCAKAGSILELHECIVVYLYALTLCFKNGELSSEEFTKTILKLIPPQRNLHDHAYIESFLKVCSYCPWLEFFVLAE